MNLKHLILILLVPATLLAAELPRLEHRWVYLATNLLVVENVTTDLALLHRAADACYTGVVLADSEFMRWDALSWAVHRMARAATASPLPPGSVISDGQTVLLSFYHTAIIHHDQLMCCLAEPKVYDILGWQGEPVH